MQLDVSTPKTFAWTSITPKQALFIVTNPRNRLPLYTHFQTDLVGVEVTLGVDSSLGLNRWTTELLQIMCGAQHDPDQALLQSIHWIRDAVDEKVVAAEVQRFYQAKFVRVHRCQVCLNTKCFMAKQQQKSKKFPGLKHLSDSLPMLSGTKSKQFSSTGGENKGSHCCTACKAYVAVGIARAQELAKNGASLPVKDVPEQHLDEERVQTLDSASASILDTVEPLPKSIVDTRQAELEAVPAPACRASPRKRTTPSSVQGRVNKVQKVTTETISGTPPHSVEELRSMMLQHRVGGALIYKVDECVSQKKDVPGPVRTACETTISRASETVYDLKLLDQPLDKYYVAHLTTAGQTYADELHYPVLKTNTQQCVEELTEMNNSEVHLVHPWFIVHL